MERDARFVTPQSGKRNSDYEEWQDHKEKILWLYRRTTLHEVMKIMASVYNFRRKSVRHQRDLLVVHLLTTPSERQYKYRLKEWESESRKDNRQRDSERRKPSHNGILATSTSVALAGPSRAHRLQINDSYENDREVLTDPPSRDALTKSLLQKPYMSPPLVLEISELIQMIARHQSEITPDNSDRVPDNESLVTHTANVEGETDSLDNYLDLIRLSVTFLQQQLEHQEEGWIILNEAFEMVQCIIQDRGVHGLKYFLDTAIYLDQVGLAAIAKDHMRYIGNMADAMNMPAIAKLFELFSTYEPKDLDAIFDDA